MASGTEAELSLIERISNKATRGFDTLKKGYGKAGTALLVVSEALQVLADVETGNSLSVALTGAVVNGSVIVGATVVGSLGGGVTGFVAGAVVAQTLPDNATTGRWVLSLVGVKSD